MGERPAPHLDRWHQLHVPPEDLAELAAWLTEVCEIRSGHARPGSVRQPRVTARLAAYRDLVERGAREVAAARAAACAAASPALPPVVTAAQAPASSGTEEVTTTEAAALADKSAAWMRQLAASGRVRARRVGRTWLLDRGDVIAMTGRSTAHGASSGEDGPGARAA